MLSDTKWNTELPKKRFLITAAWSIKAPYLLNFFANSTISKLSAHKLPAPKDSVV